MTELDKEPLFLKRNKLYREVLGVGLLQCFIKYFLLPVILTNFVGLLHSMLCSQC